jgi:hypothetical protein
MILLLVSVLTVSLLWGFDDAIGTLFCRQFNFWDVLALLLS